MDCFISSIAFLYSTFRINILWVQLFIFLFLSLQAGGTELSISETTKDQKAIICVPPLTSQVPTANLKTHYTFNGNMNDVSGTNNHGLPQVAPTLTSNRFSEPNSAYSFDGVSQWMSTTTAYTNPSIFTIGLWFKTTSTSGGGLMGFCESQTTTGFTNRDRVIYMNNVGQLEFGVYPGSIVVVKTPESYNDGYWHFASVTFSSAGMKLYVDGLLKLVNTSATTAQSMTGYWRLGYFDLTSGWSTASSNYFNGTLDDVFYYDRELSSTEIQTIYEMPDGAGSDSPKCSGENLYLKGVPIANATYAWTGPLGFTSTLQSPVLNNISSANQGIYYLTITDNLGCSTAPIPVLVRVPTVSITLSQAPTAGLISKYMFRGNSNDLSGNGNTGVLQNSPAGAPGRFGIANSAYLFNGTNQYMSTTISYNNPSIFTIAVWFNTTTTTGGKLIGFENTQTGTGTLFDRHIYMTDAGQLIFGVYDGSNTVNTGGEIYNDGQWHCAVGTLSASGLNLYVDGVLRGTAPAVITAQNYIGYWRIGNGEIGNAWPSPPTSNFFNGLLDDVYIYNVELPASSIAQYNSVDGAGSNEPFCGIGGTLNLTAPTLGTAYSYNWTGPNGFISVSQNPTISGVNTANAGIYSLKVTTTSSCPAKAFVNVRVDNIPAAPSVTSNARCGPGTVSLSASGSPLKYRWYTASSGGVSLAGASVYAPSISSTTTFYVSSVNASGCESVTRTPVTAIMNGIPAVPTGTDMARCGTGILTFNVSGSSSGYNWYDAAGGGALLSTGSAFTTPSISATTTYYVASLSPANCESALVPLKATIDSIPVEPTGMDVAICGSGTVSLSVNGSSSGYNWYTASSGGSPVGTGSTFITPFISSTTTYYVSSVSSSNCESLSRIAVSAIINSIPSVPSVVNGSRCGPGTVVLSGTGSSGTYKWYDASTGGNLIGTSPIFDPIINDTDTFYVAAVSPEGCESITRGPVTAIINSIPSEPFVTSGSRCDTGTVVLTASGSPLDYRWYITSTGGFPVGTGSNYVTPSLSSTTDFYVSSISTANCESALRTLVTATINTIPGDPSSANVDRCGPGSVVLTATGSPSKYDWYASSTGGSSLGTGASYTTPSISTTTTYYVSSLSTANCSSTNRIPVVATVNSLPSAPATIDGDICGSGTTTLEATGSSSDYNWYRSATGGLPVGKGIYFDTPILNTTTTYYVSSVDTIACESAVRTSVIARVNTIPSIPTATGDSICGPGTATLTASGSIAGYKWYDAPTGDNLLGSAATYSPSVISSDVFYVSSEINTCESSRIPVNVIVSVASNAGILNSSQTVCKGNNTGTLELINYIGAIKKWEISNDGFASDNNDLGNSTALYQYNNLIATKYYRVTVKSGTCPAITSSMVTITVDPSLPTDAGSLSADTLVLYGINSGTLTLSSYTGSIIGWEISTDNFLSSSPYPGSTPDFTFNNLVLTTSYRAVVKSGACLVKKSNIVTVTVDPPLVLVADTISTTMNRNYQAGASVLANDKIGHFYQLVPIPSITTVMGGNLILDASGYVNYTPPAEFTGIDHFSYSVCAKANLSNCITGDLVFIVKDTVIVYSSLTPNGDGINDSWIIDGINLYRDNTVKIINRWGDLVYEQARYNNKEKVWKGECNSGFAVSEKNLPDGTYFYSIDLSNGSKPITGYVVIKQ